MSVSTNKSNGYRTIQFVGKDGKRRSIRLGKVTKDDAKSVDLRVRCLNNAKIMSTPVDPETARWAANTGDDLHAKLAAVGLVEPRVSAALGAFARSGKYGHIFRHCSTVTGIFS